MGVEGAGWSLEAESDVEHRRANAYLRGIQTFQEARIHARIDARGIRHFREDHPHPLRQFGKTMKSSTNRGLSTSWREGSNGKMW